MGKKKVKGRRKGERDRLVFMAAKAVKERQRKKKFFLFFLISQRERK